MSSKARNLLSSGVTNVVQSFYDNFVQSNAELRASAGVRAVIIRRVNRPCCDWCKSLEGRYDIDNAPDNIYRRHKDCDCTVVCYDEKGYTDAWSKKVYQTEQETRMAAVRKIETRQKEAAIKNPAEKAEELEKQIKPFNEYNLTRSRQFKSLEELEKQSKSSIISMQSYEDVSGYFREKHEIELVGLEGKPLEKVKITLAGYDDFLSEFPETKSMIKEIKYNSRLRDYGTMNSEGFSQVGPIGIGDYGTGLHEAAHALDFEKSIAEKDTWSASVIKEARKKLKLKKNSKAYINQVTKIAGNYEKDEREIFAYALESEIGGVSNDLSKEIYRLVKEKHGRS